MTKVINYHAYHADYSAIADCLDAIYQLEGAGKFDNNGALLQQLRRLESDVLKKLYTRAIYLYAELSGVAPESSPLPDDYFHGDFDQEDFLFDDFYVGYVDFDSTSYHVLFRTILLIFQEIKNRGFKLDEEIQLPLVDADLVAFLTTFWQIQASIKAMGIAVCIDGESSPFNNAVGLMLQTSGSDGTQGIVPGVHLRWSFTGDLGHQHLPKGNYFDHRNVPLQGYNQADDFVHIYRTPYSADNTLFVDFLIHRPVVLAAERTWIYTINETIGNQLRTSHLRIVFEDEENYDQLLGPYDPVGDPQGFIDQYQGVLRVDVYGKSYFQLGLAVSNSSDAAQPIKLEGISGLTTGNMAATGDLSSYATEIIDAERSRTVLFMAENLKYVRIRKAQQIILKGLQVDTYEGLLADRQPEDWTEVGEGFALSLDDVEVLARLESPQKPIDNLWPHFNEGTRLRAANYVDKWQYGDADDPALRNLVSKFLTLSETDPRAMEELQRDESVTEEVETVRVSYLDVINLIAMDYHFARMLGLGHIDQDLETDLGKKYIYQARYSNKLAETGVIQEYRYTSIPASRLDDRKPEKPLMRPLTYTFPNSMGTLNDMLDTQGYHKTERMRVINIGREKYYAEEQGHNFFADLHARVNHNPALQPKPVYYGIEYRKWTDEHYVKPEITYSLELGGKDYYDYDDSHSEGVLETVPVLDNAESLYTHFITANGKHVYAIYGIDWFGRVSEVSTEVSSDETVFPAINKLQPPSNVAVQYLQEEDPLIFTTQTEQDWLRGRKQAFPGGDIGITRVTFDWLDMVDVSDLSSTTTDELGSIIKADKAQPLFLDRMPLQLIGQIKSVEEVEGEPTLSRMTTAPHILIDGSQVVPQLPAADFDRFRDSILTTADGNFRIHSLLSGQQGVDIILYKRRSESIVSDEEEIPAYGTAVQWQLPKSGDKFTTVENLGQHSNWTPVQATVSLVDFANPQQPVIETTVDIEGNRSQVWVGGITEEAQVRPLFGPQVGTDEQLPGYYEVSIPHYTLQAHPQVNIPYQAGQPTGNSPDQVNPAHVEWYRGIIRMPLAGDTDQKYKELQVVRIESQDPLLLYVVDPGFADRPIAVPAVPGDTVKVNFHPGYRAYFFNEPMPGEFHKATIEPAEGANDRKTLLTLYSQDTVHEGFTSGIATPAVLLALRHDEPQDLEPPVALGEGGAAAQGRARFTRAFAQPMGAQKVRPDSTGMGAFTFDLKIAPDTSGKARNPFGHVFYRTDEDELLEALYKPETVQAIRTSLSALTADPYYYQRFHELANQIFPSADAAAYNVFEATPQPYGFPVPDKSGLNLSSDPLAVKKLKYIGAIQSVLMPITEQPVIFNYVKEGQRTEHTVPVIRNIDGQLLDPNDATFNPFPMVRKFTDPQLPDTWFLRFTDYNLNSNSQKLYFYAAVEINAKLQPGNLSPFAGPVVVMQTVATEAPKIKGYELLRNETMESRLRGISLTIGGFSEVDKIAKIRLYRFATSEQAERLSGHQTEIEELVEGTSQQVYSVVDTFSAVDGATFSGATYYYRAVGVRTIVNEQGGLEEVLTVPSEIIAVTIPDVRKVASPVLNYDQTASKLTWQPIGTDYGYYLFRLNNQGNWIKVAGFEAPESNQEMSYHLRTSDYPKQDGDGSPLYYRFKLTAANTLGEYSIQESELTV